MDAVTRATNGGSVRFRESSCISMGESPCCRSTDSALCLSTPPRIERGFRVLTNPHNARQTDDVPQNNRFCVSHNTPLYGHLSDADVIYGSRP